MQYILSLRAKKSTCENVKSCCYGNIYEGATDTMTLTPGISHDDVFSESNFWSVKLTLEVRKIASKSVLVVELEQAEILIT